MVFICKTFHLRMLYAKFRWNWPNGSAEEDFYVSSMYFCCVVFISPLKKASPAFESPLPKNALCQIWVKLTQWFCRRRFFNFINVFLLFGRYLPLENGMALNLNELEFPSFKGSFFKFGWNWPSGSGEELFLISSVYLRYFVIISLW